MVNKTIVFKGNEYQLKYPTVGQLIDIRVMEQQLSKGMIKELITGTDADIDSYIYITTIAHVQILLPDLVKDMRVSFKDMDVMDFQELINLYSEQISPWLIEWRDKIKEKMKIRSER